MSKYLIDNAEQLTTLKDTCVVARKSIEVVFTLWNLGKTSKYELNKKGKGKTYVEFSNVSFGIWALFFIEDFTSGSFSPSGALFGAVTPSVKGSFLEKVKEQVEKYNHILASSFIFVQNFLD